MAITEVVDYVVVGAGIAGLRAAIELSRAGRVLVLTKEELGESNTQYAQGGIAVALEGEQDVALHYEDTLVAGDGLVDPLAAEVLVEEGPERVLELLRWGTNFDRKDGELMRTREGAHSRSRILHANGDATGREIGRALLEHARMQPQITLREYTTSVDLIVAEGTVRGVTMLQPDGEIAEAHARAVLLASGGAGQVYSETTNPTVATGDGIAMAYRAGAEVADMEFYQFHPTALSLPGVPRFLLSEALRGEGAYLRNARMERFMERYHPQMELAPRDVVARAITREGLAAGPGEELPVYLDMRHVTDLDLTARFPGISWFLRQNGLDLKRDLIPVRPAAHYLMGGVRTGVDGRSSLARLYAAGEAACTGVHGANRLASNSLLEGLVFGARAARFMLEEIEASGIAGGRDLPREAAHSPSSDAQRSRLQNLMWRKAGLLRDAEGLRSAAEELAEIGQGLPAGFGRPAIELRNLHTIATRIVQAALGREESRGAHFRNDFPQRDDLHYRKHSIIREGQLVFRDLIPAAGQEALAGPAAKHLPR
ncbi:MAG TPA: L-aspartate oxidase [Acidobacteriaceae bacterium]|nr:L-aspartate oxidase [Acidobacteriaceae bacterium]